jgi:hypothetical protein
VDYRRHDRSKAPAVFLSAGETFYNVREYGSISRAVALPEDIILRLTHLVDKVRL